MFFKLCHRASQSIQQQYSHHETGGGVSLPWRENEPNMHSHACAHAAATTTMRYPPNQNGIIFLFFNGLYPGGKIFS